MFDTNAMHAADVHGQGARTTIVLEFHPWGKAKLMSDAHKKNPCPRNIRVKSKYLPP